MSVSPAIRTELGSLVHLRSTMDTVFHVGWNCYCDDWRWLVDSGWLVHPAWSPPPQLFLVVSGLGSTLSAQPYCGFTSSHSGLVGPTRGTGFVCMIAIDGSIANAWFVVAAGASGSHSVAVRYDMGRRVSAPVGFSADCLAAKLLLAAS